MCTRHIFCLDLYMHQYVLGQIIMDTISSNVSWGLVLVNPESNVCLCSLRAAGIFGLGILQRLLVTIMYNVQFNINYVKISQNTAEISHSCIFSANCNSRDRRLKTTGKIFTCASFRHVLLNMSTAFFGHFLEIFIKYVYDSSIVT